MSIFDSIRDSVTARDVAEFYGLKVNRYGKAACPFHNDRNPSMKVDKRFYCFGCGEKGDAVDLVSKLFGLTLKDAAMKIADDFGISYEKWKPPDPAGVRPVLIVRSIYERYRNVRNRFWRAITDYYHMLLEWKEIYAPKDPEEEPDNRYVEAIQNITTLEYVMDSFLQGDLETQVGIINDFGRKTVFYERRLKESVGREAGRAGKDNEDSGAGGGGEAA